MSAPTTTRTPHVRYSRFVMPREGMSLEECEDAVGVNLGALRFAVADGATEAFDARSWARALAEGWAAEGRSAPVGIEEFGRWVGAEGARLHECWEGRELPWYAEEKARGGSFAAFVGLCIEVGAGAGGEGLRWRSVALGDACLVWRRGGRILSAMPLSASDGFNSSPPLVPSRARLLESALARAVTGEGDARAGDSFLLLTDAAARWFLSQHEERARALAEFDSLLAGRENDALAELLRGERRAGRMGDDDVAVLLVTVGAGD